MKIRELSEEVFINAHLVGEPGERLRGTEIEESEQAVINGLFEELEGEGVIILKKRDRKDRNPSIELFISPIKLHEFLARKDLSNKIESLVDHKGYGYTFETEKAFGIGETFR